MSFFKKKQLPPDVAEERLARTIADQIIFWQHLLAGKLNKVINRYSRPQQKWLLLIFCGMSAGLLALSLLVPIGKLGVPTGQNYQTSHIGMPSDIPIKKEHLNTKDSLFTKK